MNEREAAERLCALLNEVSAAGYEVDLWDFEVLIGKAGVKYSAKEDVMFEVTTRD